MALWTLQLRFHMTRKHSHWGFVVTDVELLSQLLLCVMPWHHSYLDTWEEHFIPAMMVNPLPLWTPCWMLNQEMVIRPFETVWGLYQLPTMRCFWSDHNSSTPTWTSKFDVKMLVFKCANIYEFQAKINMDRSRINTEELWTWLWPCAVHVCRKALDKVNASNCYSVSIHLLWNWFCSEYCGHLLPFPGSHPIWNHG
jgi:hypothetical protein